MEKKKSTAIDDYINEYPEDVQLLLRQMRETIKAILPDAEEKISYQMPTFFQKKNLVHFAAFKHHIGFYPTPSAIAFFESELTSYKRSKGAVQFPIDEPLPLELVSRMTQFRKTEVLG